MHSQILVESKRKENRILIKVKIPTIVFLTHCSKANKQKDPIKPTEEY